MPTVLRLSIALFAIAVLCGSGAAFFLWGLSWVTQTRIADPRFFLLAPFVGLITGWVFSKMPAGAGSGNVLLVALSRRSTDLAGLRSIPVVLAPLIILMTWISHFAGFSVGREGTAVQMGGGVAGWISRLIKTQDDRESRLLLFAGLGAGFAAVFGVPWAGTIFSFEVSHSAFRLTFRDQRGSRFSKANRMPWLLFIKTFLICLACSYLADSLAHQISHWTGVQHSALPAYSLRDIRLDTSLVVYPLAALIFGLIAWFFLWATHQMKILVARMVQKSWLRPAFGGLFFAPMVLAPPSLLRYCGIGSHEIESVFVSAPPLWDWIGKFVATILTLAAGLKGGEVTPLFFIGSSVGSALAGVFSVAPASVATLGLVAVFAAAADLPLTCSVLAFELCGPDAFLMALPVCYFASSVCRHVRLYDGEGGAHGEVGKPEL
jgi:H+/Cl- antiporter ClcA